MRVFKFLPPYDRDGKTTFPAARKRSGVYLIKENGILVYVGYSGTDLYKTLYRHFQEWNDKQYRVTYQSRLSVNNYTVRVIFCTSKQATKLEAALILDKKPRDCENKYDLFDMDASETRALFEYEEQIIERDAPF